MLEEKKEDTPVVQETPMKKADDIDGEINLQNLSSGEVHCVRTQLKDKRYDVKPDVSGPVRHLVIGR